MKKVLLFFEEDFFFALGQHTVLECAPYSQRIIRYLA